MPLSLRSHSANTYCLSKLWFKCASIDLRALDISKITSLIKSWIYADQLEKPEELVLYRSRKMGGLNLYNVKLRAMAEQIKSFLDTAINPTFRHSLYHQALYHWHIEDVRTIPNPGRPGYYSEDFFSTIKSVKNEGLLKIATLSIGLWYKVLLENFVTTEVDENGFRFNKRCKIEVEHPSNDWDRTWSLSCIAGLASCDYTFLWKMIHNILPTQERLHRILPSVSSPLCTLCNSQNTCSLPHALFTCSYNCEVGNWLTHVLSKYVLAITPQQVILLDLNIEDKLCLPIVWLIAQTLSIIWNFRVEKKTCTLFSTRALLEANIMLPRKTRFETLLEMLNSN